jgi:hypothetical protein
MSSISARVLAVVAAATVTGCDLVMPRPSRVTMQAEISALLYTGDTLVVRRTISNGEPDTLWLNVSPLSLPFSAADLSGQPACHPGPQIAVAQFLAVPPAQSVTHERLFPLATLGACGPGIYTMRIHAQLYRDDRGRRQERTLSWGAPSLLVREVPPEP